MDDYKTVMMKPNDHVATALTMIPADVAVRVVCQEQIITLKLIDSIEFGHKFAVKSIKQGDEILKYGEVIGVATRDISLGEHVHVHNLEGQRGRGDRVGHDES